MGFNRRTARHSAGLSTELDCGGMGQEAGGRRSQAEADWLEGSHVAIEGRRQGEMGAREGSGISGVEIIGVAPRLNFDTFFSAFTSVFIIWTLTDWSFVMQPLLVSAR